MSACFAAVLASLAEGTSRFADFPCTADTLTTLECLAQLGVPIDVAVCIGKVEIEGAGIESLVPPEEPLECGASSMTLLLMMGLLAGRPWTSVLHGEPLELPHLSDCLRVPLHAMGARLSGAGSHCDPPITIRGACLQGSILSLGATTAAIKPALLLAGLQARGHTALVQGRPEPDHYDNIIQAFGIPLYRAGASVGLDSTVAPRAVESGWERFKPRK